MTSSIVLQSAQAVMSSRENITGTLSRSMAPAWSSSGIPPSTWVAWNIEAYRRSYSLAASGTWRAASQWVHNDADDDTGLSLIERRRPEYQKPGRTRKEAIVESPSYGTSRDSPLDALVVDTRPRYSGAGTPAIAPPDGDAALHRCACQGRLTAGCGLVRQAPTGCGPDDHHKGIPRTGSLTWWGYRADNEPLAEKVTVVLNGAAAA